MRPGNLPLRSEAFNLADFRNCVRLGRRPIKKWSIRYPQEPATGDSVWHLAAPVFCRDLSRPVLDGYDSLGHFLAEALKI